MSDDRGPGRRLFEALWARVSIRRSAEYWLPVLTGLGVLLAWEATARFAGRGVELVVVPVEAILSRVVTFLATGAIASHAVVTITEVALSVALAAVLGVPIGAAIGSRPLVREAVEPLVYYVSSVPKIVLYPLLIVLFGIGIESKVAKGTLSALFPVLVTSIVGASRVNPTLVSVARLHGASRWHLLSKLYLHAMAGHVLRGIRLGFGVAVISVLFAEIFAAQAGLGHRINFYFENLRMASVYALLALIFGGTFAVNVALRRLGDRLADRGYETGTDAGTGFF